MIVTPLEQELHVLCCEEWRAKPGADPANVYYRALKEIENLRCASHWATGSPAEFPLASPRPWGLYGSDNRGLSIICMDPYHDIFSFQDKERHRQNSKLIVRAVNNWK
jgi:hypothetical protein